MAALGDMLQSLIKRGARWVDKYAGADLSAIPTPELCQSLLSSRGEATGLTLAATILDRVDHANESERLAFFKSLAQDFDVDPESVLAAAQALAADPSPAHLETLRRTSEPQRQILFRHLNQAPGGTQRLVRLREKLMQEMIEHPNLRRIDNDLKHLFRSWFNRGFLMLEHIDWGTSAEILEKIIAYEAVHEINDWEDLRRRLQPPDRRCFAFFHPAMATEPLVFVEVALTETVAHSIQAVLSAERAPIDPDDARTAIFYSISNCQEGLRGISFGAFLIKQVVQDLSRDFPKLETFATLSPLPGFTRWLRTWIAENEDSRADIRALLEGPRTMAALAPFEDRLMALAAQYLLSAKREDGRPPDPVARFHLQNGASVHRLNWMADISKSGLAQSLGIMVNYHYDLNELERNHEAYQSEQKIAASRKVRSFVPDVP